MSDTHFQDPDTTAPQASPGELLRRERDTLGLSRAEVAAALNLRPAVIDGLENDSYEEIPIATYRRGYLRSYASLLGLNEEQVLEAYHARFGKEETELNVTPVHVVNKPPSRLGAWLFRLVTLAVIAGLIGLTLMWWQSRGGNEPPAPSDNSPVAVDSLDGNATVVEDSSPEAASEDDPQSGSSAQEPSNANATGSEPNLLEAPDGATSDNEAPAAATDATQSEATPSDDAQDTDAQDDTEQTTSTATEGNDSTTENAEADVADTESTAHGSPGVMNLTFNEQSWTEIFDASNQRVFVGLQEPGTTARVEGEPPFRLTVGNATGVELDWNGETIDLSERAGANNVARFTLGE